MTISVPGRTELAGNHTDHQGGHVLAAAVDLLVQGNVEPKKDDRVVLTSDGYGQIQVDLRYLDSHFSKPGTAEALVRGVLDYLNKEGYPIHGLRLRYGRISLPARGYLPLLLFLFGSEKRYRVYTGQKMFRP